MDYAVADLEIRGTASGYMASKVLRAVDIPIISRLECAEGLRTTWNPDITDNMICAGDMEDDEVNRPCRYDSGSPAIDSATGVLVGVTSWNPRFCTNSRLPSGYARVGSLRSFIDEYLDASDRL